MPGYRLEEKISGSQEWRTVEEPSPLGVQQRLLSGKRRIIYSTMRAASHDCLELHDKNPQDEHRVVNLTNHEVMFDIQPASLTDDERPAKQLRQDLEGVLFSDFWTSPSERDLYIRAVTKLLTRLSR